jgi:hypothetical protein
MGGQKNRKVTAMNEESGLIYTVNYKGWLTG